MDCLDDHRALNRTDFGYNGTPPPKDGDNGGRNNMSPPLVLLIPTVSKLLLHVAGTNYTIHEGRGYSGATWNKDLFFVAARTRSCEEYESWLQVYNRGLELVADHFLPDIKHAMQAFYWDQKIYFANCYRNKITARSMQGTHQDVYWSGTEWEGNKLSDHHINSLWCSGNRFYVCEHRRGPSRVQILDLEWNLLDTVQMGAEIHNVYVEGDNMYVNNSFERGVLIRNLKTGKERKICVADYLDWNPKAVFEDELIKTIGYTRGFARTKDHFYIGCSAIADRGDRDKGEGIVAVFDNDFSFVRKIVLPDTGGISNIRVLSEIDYAHNRIPMPWDGTLRGEPIV